ncbi:MAG: LysR family transcriptional regulator [Firmicutes bacterium]|nr:LysR family transcriptional regulator [Bacillota bacterium]MBQ9060266.1 LysR family transcriptional regulator [Bacillota bacterium]
MIKYKAFIEVAEKGNYTKAAKAMGYSQPGISHMIDTLEKEFGFPLLRREKNTIVPTNDGEKILHYCYRLLQDERELLETVDAIKGLMTGTIKAATLNSMAVDFLPEIVLNFTHAFSGINVVMHEFAIEDGIQAVLSGQMDLLFGTDGVPDTLDFIPLFTDPIGLIMREDHPFARYDRIPVGKLSSSDFIMPEVGWDDLARPLLDALDTPPNVRHYTASETASISLVSHGMGVFPFSKLQTKLLPANVTFREFQEGFYRNMGISLRSEKDASPAQREFIRFAKACAESL